MLDAPFRPQPWVFHALFMSLAITGCGETGFDSDLDSVVNALESNAVVQLPLDDGVGGIAVDISGNGNDGSLVNGAAFEGATGDGSAFAVRFDGVDDFIDLGPLDVNGTGLTLAVWFRTDSFPGPSKDPRLISKATGTAANDHVFMLSTIRAGSQIRLRARVRVGGTTTTLIAGSGDLTADEWKHAAVTYDGATLRLYLDAVEVGSTPMSGPVDTAPSVPVTVGSQPPGAGPRFFDGLIDDVRILSRALSQSELDAILNVNEANRAPIALNDSYQTPEDTPLSVNAVTGVLSNDTDPDSDPLQAVLVGDVSNGALTLNPDGSFDYAPNPGFIGQDGFTYVANDTELDSDLASVTISVSDTSEVDAVVELPLNEGAGGVAVDISGNGNDGILLNGAAFEASTGDGSAFSVRFDGVDDFIDLGGLDVSGPGLTLSAWFNADSFPGSSKDPRLISKATGTSANAHVFMLSTIAAGSAIRLRARVRVGGTTTTLIASSGDLAAGEWRHAAVTYDGVTLRLYLDAIEVGSAPLSGAVDVAPSVPVTLGSQPPGAGPRFFDGLIDDVRILSRALSQSELAAIVNVNQTNRAPIALNDSYQTPEENPLSVNAANGVLKNDTDPDSDPLQAVLVDNASNGTLTLNADGSFDYAPDPGFSGQDGFTYVANDTELDSGLASVTISVSSVGGTEANWWTSSLSKRLPIAVSSQSIPLQDGVASVEVDLLSALGGAALDPDQFRLVEYDASGEVIDPAVPFQFDPAQGFDAVTDPRGTLLIVLTGNTPSSTERTYHLYFAASSGATFYPPPVLPLVAPVELVSDEGQASYKVTTPAGTWFYQLQGGGFSSLEDPNGNDWISYQPGGGSAGEFRGIPNLVYPEGHFHPGATSSQTTLLSQGPLKMSFTSETTDGWRMVWDVYPAWATATVVDAPKDYWFLYEGTPGGAVEPNADTVTRSGGVTTPLSQSWTQDLPGPEWVYFTDPAQGRALFVALHEDDAATDSYRTMNSEMTVFGFGRDDLGRELSGTPKTFSVGLSDSASVEGAIASATAPVVVQSSAAESRPNDPTATTAAIAPNVTVGGVPLTVSFGGLGSNDPGGSIVSYAWDFGDGTTGSGPTPSHVYAAPGIYEITLTVTDADGAMVEDRTSLVVAPSAPPPNAAPTAQGSATPLTGTAPLTVSFDASASSDDGTIVSYAWDFGDGATGSGALTSHVYTMPGTYTATVTVTDDGGLTGSASFTITALSGGGTGGTGGSGTGGTGGTAGTGGPGNDQPRFVTGSVAFIKRVVDDTLGETHAVAAADFTGDGHVDLVATDFVDSMVFWYENDGAGGFVTRVLDPFLGGAYPIGVGDVDGDGRVDVLAAGYEADTFVWYESDGTGGFTGQYVDTASDGAHSMVSGDLDDDGDFDLVTSSQDSNNISWYENDGANGFTRHVIDSSAVGAKRAEIGDIDGDGDQDVVTASFFSDEIAWHENDGNENFTKRIIDTTANGAYYVSPADIDGDGDLDVFSASQLDNTIAWYRNDGAFGFSYQPINTAASGARTVIAADINGDGNVDAVTASVSDDTVAWYENDGSGSFTGHVVDSGADGAYGVFAIDINQDSLLDILSASRDAEELAIHTQMRAHSINVDLGGSIVISGALLRAEDADDGPFELTYTITASPGSGMLELGGAALSPGNTFTQQDIDDGLLSYTHDGVDQSADSFDFTVSDGGEDGTQPILGSVRIAVLGFTGPIVELPMDEGVGTVAGDVSGQGNDGVLVNGATFEASTGDGSAFAVRFDGANDYIDLGALDVNGTGLTLSASFNADSFPGPSDDPRLISKATGTEASEHVFMLGTIRSGSEVRLRARLRHGGVTTTLIANSGSLVTGEWYHAAVTSDGERFLLYLDGVEVGSALFAGTVDLEPTAPVAVGAQPPGAGGRYFDGLIDDVRILSRGLSPSEVAQLAAGVN